MGIADTSASSTDCASRRKLARFAAVIIGVVANRSVFELACFSIAALVICTGVGVATITVLTRLNDPVSALLRGYGRDAFVVG